MGDQVIVVSVKIRWIYFLCAFSEPQPVLVSKFNYCFNVLCFNCAKINHSAGICSSSLGLEDGRIRYGQLTSSSHHENNPADAGRLNIAPNV